MKNKLIIVADLGLLKVYRLTFTPEQTPRLEQLEELVLVSPLDLISTRLQRHKSFSTWILSATPLLPSKRLQSDCNHVALKGDPVALGKKAQFRSKWVAL
jgi:hypothetical protein